jgi:hypothetical protein
MLFRIGAPDPPLTGAAGLLAVAELAGRVGLIDTLDAAVPGFKQRRRGASAGEFMTAMACAQLTGADHLVGLDHRRADVVAEAFFDHASPASSTATGLARRFEPLHEPDRPHRTSQSTPHPSAPTRADPETPPSAAPTPHAPAEKINYRSSEALTHGTGSERWRAVVLE